MGEVCPARTSSLYSEELLAESGGQIAIWDKDIPDTCMGCIQRALLCASIETEQEFTVYLDPAEAEENVTTHVGLVVFGDSNRRVVEDTAEDLSDCTISSIVTSFKCRSEERAY